MKTNDNQSSEGGFGLEALHAELMRTSDEILNDIKADIDPWVAAPSSSKITIL
jgi:hypothetical protein